MMLREEALAQHTDGTGENEGGGPLNLVRTLLGGAVMVMKKQVMQQKEQTWKKTR